MARAIIWPAAPVQAPEAPASPAAAIHDPTGLAAAFGPELTRLFGARCAARLLENPAVPLAEACSHMVAELRLPAPAAGAKPAAPGAKAPLAESLPATVTLLLPPTDVARLLDMLFGGAAATSGVTLHPLPPGSASWMALARFLADSAARALLATGQRCQGPAEIPLRPAPPAEPRLPQLLLKLDIDGAEALLGLRVDGIEVQAPASPPDPEAWRQQASARVLDLVLPVALRLQETRIPVSQIINLSPGDILPLDRPSSVELLAGGRHLDTLPATRFAANPEGAAADSWGAAAGSKGAAAAGSKGAAAAGAFTPDEEEDRA